MFYSDCCWSKVQNNNHVIKSFVCDRRMLREKKTHTFSAKQSVMENEERKQIKQI